MRRIFDFRCTATGKLYERLVSGDTDTVQCACGETANRVISAVRVGLDPISGDFPKATTRWAKNRQKQIAIERKNQANHGTHR